MSNIYKTEEQLTGELAGLRQRVAELAASETERKRAEEALRKAEQEKNAILDSMSELMAFQDMEHRLIWVNKAAAESVDLPPEQLVGRHCYEIWPQLRQPCEGCPVAKARESGKTQEAEITTPDGRLWFVRGYPIRDANDDLVGVVEVTLDITECKQAEEALRESEEFRSSLLTNSPIPMLVINPDTSVRYVNSALEKLTGFSSAEVIGRKAPYLWWTEETLQKTSGDLAEAMRHGAVTLEELFQKKNGERFWVEITSTPVSKDGEFKYYLADWVDITERKQAEEALQKSQEELRKMFESVTDGISVIDLNGVITRVNQRTVEMHGFSSRDGVVGRSALELVAPRDHERVKTNMRKALKRGTIKGVEYTLLRADGSEFPGELSTSVLRDAAGNLVGHITIARDITERKQAEKREKRLREELYRSSRLASVGELAAGVAHEMNNPLTGILGFSQRLLRKSSGDNTKEGLELIHNEAQRAAKVVKNLLTFARRREPKKEYSDINDILQTTLDLRAYELKTGNIEVILGLAAKLPQIMVDFYQIQEVFLNLILNAEQAMIEAHGGGKLTIKTEKIEDYIRISFTDDGPGIPAVNLDRLFDPFFTTRGERGGTGLGLSLCHGIVAEHGGRICARSKAREGAMVLVQLPLSRQLPLATEKIDESKVAEEKLA